MTARNFLFLFIMIAVASCSLFTLHRSNAMAQEASKSFTITVDQGELNVIGEALGAMPFNKVAALMNKLQQQVIKQQVPSSPVDANGNKSEPKK